MSSRRSTRLSVGRWFKRVGDPVMVYQLPDQIATLTHLRSLTARLLTCAEQAQNHCQICNMGLALRVIIDGIESLEDDRKACP